MRGRGEGARDTSREGFISDRGEKGGYLYRHTDEDLAASHLNVNSGDVDPLAKDGGKTKAWPYVSAVQASSGSATIAPIARSEREHSRHVGLRTSSFLLIRLFNAANSLTDCQFQLHLLRFWM
mgnify:CR=1 FL=1